MSVRHQPDKHGQFGPSPIQYLPNLTKELGGKVKLWAKREDCNSGLAYGGNKVRKVCHNLPYEQVYVGGPMTSIAEEGT